jgi:hypothetical protein
MPASGRFHKYIFFPLNFKAIYSFKKLLHKIFLLSRILFWNFISKASSPTELSTILSSRLNTGITGQLVVVPNENE